MNTNLALRARTQVRRYNVLHSSYTRVWYESRQSRESSCSNGYCVRSVRALSLFFFSLTRITSYTQLNHLRNTTTTDTARFQETVNVHRKRLFVMWDIWNHQAWRIAIGYKQICIHIEWWNILPMILVLERKDSSQMWSVSFGVRSRKVRVSTKKMRREDIFVRSICQLGPIPNLHMTGTVVPLSMRFTLSCFDYVGRISLNARMHTLDFDQHQRSNTGTSQVVRMLMLWKCWNPKRKVRVQYPHSVQCSHICLRQRVFLHDGSQSVRNAVHFKKNIQRKPLAIGVVQMSQCDTLFKLSFFT